ncbi:hypothetical protein [Rhodococcus sp. HNM0569]|nr:hypothetical protein [Rhodococcus sp. HNM0569]NLU81976.1 hypothetical protein [Rhodococcus sp. HNM0569]
MKIRNYAAAGAAWPVAILAAAAPAARAAAERAAAPTESVLTSHRFRYR